MTTLNHNIEKMFSQKTITLSLMLILGFISLQAQTNGSGLSDVEDYELVDPRRLIPPANGEPVLIKATFHLQDIDDIKDEQETFVFAGYLTLTWHDPNQAFDPVETGVEEKFYQGSFQFNEASPSWYPQVGLANAYGMYERRAVLQRVKSDGTCTLIESINATAKTRLDLRRYPFDSQRLQVYFKVIGLDEQELIFDSEAAAATCEKDWIRVPQWNLTGVDASVSTITAPYTSKESIASTYVLTVDVNRDPFFMLRLVVIPLGIIAMLSWSVFWMQRSSLGDRMSVSFVGILTAVTYQVVVSSILPQISYLTFIHAFLNMSFFVMCSTVLINLLVGAYDKKGNKKRGDQIDHACRWIFPGAYALLIFISVIYTFY